jgi:FtsZ-binding cell division protein ZapB
MYKEGRQIVTDIAKEVDGVVKDVKTVQKKAKGLLGFLSAVFGKKEEVQLEVAQPVKKVKKKKEPPPEFDENLIYQQVSDALIKFYRAYNALKNYTKEQEEFALHANNEEGQEAAINITIANLQMEKLNTELSDYMVYHVPLELKDLYTRVNQQIGHIANVQALARREEMLKERRAKWQRRQKADLIRGRMVASVITVLMLMWIWLMILSLTHSPSY